MQCYWVTILPKPKHVKGTFYQTQLRWIHISSYHLVFCFGDNHRFSFFSTFYFRVLSRLAFPDLIIVEALYPYSKLATPIVYWMTPGCYAVSKLWTRRPRIINFLVLRFPSLIFWKNKNIFKKIKIFLKK